MNYPPSSCPGDLRITKPKRWFRQGAQAVPWAGAEVIDALQQRLMVDVNIASQFTRAVIGGTQYYSLAYTQVTKKATLCATKMEKLHDMVYLSTCFL